MSLAIDKHLAAKSSFLSPGARPHSTLMFPRAALPASAWTVSKQRILELKVTCRSSSHVIVLWIKSQHISEPQPLAPLVVPLIVELSITNKYFHRKFLREGGLWRCELSKLLTQRRQILSSQGTHISPTEKQSPGGWIEKENVLGTFLRGIYIHLASSASLKNVLEWVSTQATEVLGSWTSLT